VLAIKDMAGLVRPRAAYTLGKALKEEVGLPVHFHTHDTSRHRRRQRTGGHRRGATPSTGRSTP